MTPAATRPARAPAARALRAVSRFSERTLEGGPIGLNTVALGKAAESCASTFRAHLCDLVVGDNLGRLAHLANGCGNFRHAGHTWIEYLADFARITGSSRWCVPQDRELGALGDNHPWQAFAYMIMAGLDPDGIVPRAEATIREMALDSRQIDNYGDHELGHLLFAAAHLTPDPDTPFAWDGQRCSLRELFGRARNAQSSAERTCRHVHLAEGLCAAARVWGIDEHLHEAQRFLNWQLGLLVPLGAALEAVRDDENRAEVGGDSGIIDEIAGIILLDRSLDDYVLVGGHFLELAAFADLLGYNLTKVQRNAVVYVANEVGERVYGSLTGLDPSHCFAALAHFRRAATLLVEIERAAREGRSTTRDDLAAYTVNFDAVDNVTPKPRAAGRPSDEQPRTIVWRGSLGPTARQEFSEVLAAFRSVAPGGFEPSGTEPDHRSMRLTSWCCGVQYELLDYGDRFGVEIHLETDIVRPLGETLRSSVGPMAVLFPEAQVLWDREWSRRRGRLQILFGPGTPAAAIAAAMAKMIGATWPALDAAISAL